MSVRKKVPTLRGLCLSYISSNIDVWNKQTNSHCGEKVSSNDTTIACLPNSILDDIFIFIKCSKLLLPRHLDILIHKNSKKFDFSRTSYEVVQRGIHLICNICPHLEYLDLSRSTIDENHLMKLAMSIPSIISLKLYLTESTDNVLLLLGSNCPKLRILDICECAAVTDIGINALCGKSLASDSHKNDGRCRLIQSLSITGTAISEEGALTAICNLPFLCEFNYDNSLKIIETIYERYNSTKMNFKLKNLSYTRSLAVHISNSTIDAAAALCQNVTQISLTDIKTTDQWISQLKNFPKLVDLTLTGALDLDFGGSLSYNECVAPLLKTTGNNLDTLTLSFMSGVNVWDIGKNCPRLTWLGLHSCRDYSSILIPRVPHCSFVELNILNVELYPDNDIPQEQLEDLLSNSPHLQLMCLYGCQSLTDELLSRVFDRNPLSELMTLDINDCDYIGKTSIFKLIRRCNSLSYLRYSNCARIDVEDEDEIEDFVRNENLNLMIL